MYIAGILILIFLIAYRYAGLDVFLISVFTKEKTPKEYAAYKNLSQIKDFGSHHTVALISKAQAFSPRLQLYEISDSCILIHAVTAMKHFDNGAGDSGDNYTNVLKKIDAKGNVIDTLHFKSSSSNQSEFGNPVVANKQLVNMEKAYYQTWPTDGDKTKKKFVMVNKDFAWSDEKIASYYSNIAFDAKYLQNLYYYLDDSVPYDKRKCKVFFRNNEWHILFGLTDEIKDDSYNRKPVKSESVAISENDGAIKFRYFQKTSYESYLMGSHNGSGTYKTYYWKGTAYFDLKMANDTLHFKKEDVTLEDYDTRKKFKKDIVLTKEQKLQNLAKEISVYKNPNMDFVLLQEDLRSDNLYVAKRK